MKADTTRGRVRSQIRGVLRSMGFVADCMKRAKGAHRDRLHDVYQSLGIAWDRAGLECKHWDGFRRLRSGDRTCRICGKVAGVTEAAVLVPSRGIARVGARRLPISKRTFPNKRSALVDAGTIRFHGANLHVEVHNAYASHLFRGKVPITIAAERSVRLREGEVECRIDSYMTRLSWDRAKRRDPGYAGFPAELPKRVLRRCPFLVEYDANERVIGVTVFRSAGDGEGKRRRKR